MALMLLDGERDRLAAVVADLGGDAPRLAYADWLESRDPGRARFLRDFVRASASMEPDDFPRAEGLPEEWLELIGFRLLERLADADVPELKDAALRLARPALRIRRSAAASPRRDDERLRPRWMNHALGFLRSAPPIKPSDDEGGEIAVGASRIGGLPDLPPGFRWPRAADCRAIYIDEVEGGDGPAGFLGQIDLAEIAGTHAARDLPAAGVLSFFCYQGDEDHPDQIGAKAVFFPDASVLVRTEPPEEPSASNAVMPPRRLGFEETLDLPEYASGPWSGEITPDPRVRHDALDDLLLRNHDNLLGYGRATTGDDPTSSKESRHLVILQNAAECWLHIQIGRDALAARDFDRITLCWVDFDPGDVPEHLW